MIFSSTLAVTLAATLVPAPAPAVLTSAQRKVLTEATRQFRDTRAALAAGYQRAHDCVPGMGYHWAHPARSADTVIDPALPEILLYDRHGRLLGLEYFTADADGNLKTDPDRPTLFGNRFDGPMAGHQVPHGHPPMPVHYDLHVWLYEPNPSGKLATVNPKVTCP